MLTYEMEGLFDLQNFLTQKTHEKAPISKESGLSPSFQVLFLAEASPDPLKSDDVTRMRGTYLHSALLCRNELHWSGRFVSCDMDSRIEMICLKDGRF